MPKNILHDLGFIKIDSVKKQVLSEGLLSAPIKQFMFIVPIIKRRYI